MEAGYRVKGMYLIPYGAAANASHYPREFHIYLTSGFSLFPEFQHVFKIFIKNECIMMMS
jgi:hypothetical protein